MPFEVMHDITPAEVTPEPGKGALGTWRSLGEPRTQSRNRSFYEAATSPRVNHSERGCTRASA